MANGSSFGAGRLFLADARLAYGAANYARHRALHRVFGVDRENANLLTAVVVVSAGPPMAAALWRSVRKPIALVTGVNVGVGVFAVREATLGVVGPGANEVPNAGAMLLLAVAGGLALPQVRRALLGLRTAEHRVRSQRERMYETARGTMRRAPVGAGAQASSSEL
jgi:hypothetical protein